MVYKKIHTLNNYFLLQSERRRFPHSIDNYLNKIPHWLLFFVRASKAFQWPLHSNDLLRVAGINSLGVKESRRSDGNLHTCNKCHTIACHSPNSYTNHVFPKWTLPKNADRCESLITGVVKWNISLYALFNESTVQNYVSKEEDISRKINKIEQGVDDWGQFFSNGIFLTLKEVRYFTVSVDVVHFRLQQIFC